MSDYVLVWWVYLMAFSVFFAAFSMLLLRGASFSPWKLYVLSALFVFNLMPTHVGDGVFAPFLAGFAIDVIAGKLVIARYMFSLMLAVVLAAVIPFLIMRFITFPIVNLGQPALEQ